MTIATEIWRMSAGIAFFMLAMTMMQSSLQQLSGRQFKLLLRKHTDNKFKAITEGAIVTGVLQSSSVANLLFLSMAGTSVIRIENALSLMLGANLGSTITSWIVATLGFNYNIENAVLPAVGIAGIIMAFTNTNTKPFLWSKFLFSIAFLFIALGFIKSGMENYVMQTDLSVFNRYPPIIFLLIGITFTAIVQSSSVTIALVLSALYTHTISLYTATAIALGSELGTTLKFFLVSFNATAVQKRAALGNFLFNLVTVAVIYPLLGPLNFLISNVLCFTDNLLALVFFQTFVNICCIFLFLPFLSSFGKFLQKKFSDQAGENTYIHNIQASETTLALEAAEKETELLLHRVIIFCKKSFGLASKRTEDIFERKTTVGQYIHIKQVHGELQQYLLQLQKSPVEKEETERPWRLIASIRNAMYAAKSISDAAEDVRQVSNSSNDIKYNFYLQICDKLLQLYDTAENLLHNKVNSNSFDDLVVLYRNITEGYSETLKLLYAKNLRHSITETEISTLINFNREIYSSLKSLALSLNDYLLSSKEVEYFDSLPGFIK